MGLLPKLIACPRNGIVEGICGGNFCKGNKLLWNTYI